MSLLLTFSSVSIFNFEHVIAKLPFLERDIHVTYITLPDSVKKWIFFNFFFLRDQQLTSKSLRVKGTSE